MISELLSLFDLFYDSLLFLFNNTVLTYLIGLCIISGVFGIIKSIISR